ncbi:MAG: single-stranded DNA-binding protein, partial [Clostridia bacterium]|nr:single-stranded DNA-binding protein [Clostridia bacterium]
AVQRLSQVDDFIPVLISERLLDSQLIATDNQVTVVGQFRSYNKMVGNKSKLVLTVFARDVMPVDTNANPNFIQLQGFVCKPPVFRTTPFSREIADLLIAVNRQYNKSDYIPCITWGRNARFCKNLPVGEQVLVVGRIQSRQYQKKLDDEQTVTLTAYEVSVSKISQVQPNVAQLQSDALEVSVLNG